MGNSESIAAATDEQSDTEHTATSSQRSHHRQRRRQRRITLDSTPPADTDCPWWSKIENESLILDYAPNITFQVNENESVTAKATLSHEALDALLKRYENVNVNDSECSVHARLTRNHNNNSTQSDTSTEQESATSAPIEVVNEEAVADDKSPAREQSLEEFKEELRVKRLARQTAVQDLRDEITTLRQQLAQEQAITRHLRSSDCSAENAAIIKEHSAEPSSLANTVDADDADPLSRSRHANIELANVQLALQLSQAENLSLRTELGVVQKQVGTLKEVISCCKQMLAVKEEQCTQLKAKLQEIEVSFGEREMKIMSSNLRQEYERQLVNIRQLRQLYEERQRIAAAEQENLQRLISIKRDELQAEQEKTKNYEERNQALVKEVENANIELAALREECNEHKFEKKTLKEEMGAINTLFTQMVMGFNGKNNLDIDRLTAMLEENRTLLNEMTTKEANCSDGATLPKLLFELVEQAAVVDKIKSHNSRCTTPMSEGDADDAAEHADDDVACSDEGNAEATVAGNACTLAKVDSTTTTTAAAQPNADVTNDNDADAEQLLGATALSDAQDANNLATAAVATATATKTKKPSKRTHSSKTKAMLSFPEAETMIGKVTSAQEIIGNLPKVWKVLMELLSHHKIEQVQFEENGASEDCYKSVETPNGPKAELSVSKTYIKLKDLILEKKSLMKETNRLKTLNSHLDYRLNEQEKRLSAVSLELTKTWHLVGKMQRQHRQLHTQEQILRYQLQQKRRLLSELKDELEYCRRKWAAARAKNDESQEQCNDLRREFAQRKLDDANHSAESGYSDSGPASDEEERNGVNATAAVPSSSSSSSSAAAATPNASTTASTSACSRRKHLKEMFEHTRKIKRMQSTSPGRAAGIQPAVNEEIVVLRWNSAPPTCGWRSLDGADDEDDDDDDNDDADDDVTLNDDADIDGQQHAGMLTPNRGAIPKAVPHNSRSKQRTRTVCATAAAEEDIDTLRNSNDAAGSSAVPATERATRIQRLEEQCKSLIQKVLETSDNRERLEIQLCRFQDDVAPVQYAVPLDEFINRKRIERMTRASSAPARGSLTPREEEYTRKRSERLERLEEESRQLMSRIKRTTDRGHYLRCSLDRIRRATPRDDSCESNTEDELLATVDEARTQNTRSLQATVSVGEAVVDKSPLTAEEEAFTARRAARLERLEAEGRNLMQTLTRQSERSAAGESQAGSAGDSVDKPSPLTAEEEAYTARRAARLQRLEAEGRSLLETLTRQTQRGGSIEHKLDHLHERYGANNATADNEQPTESIEKRLENIEQISQNRDERLRTLEAEGKALLSRLTNTSERGTQMINRIAERELNRRRSNSSTPKREEAEIQEQTAAATSLLPTPNNVACASIVDEVLSDALVVTTTSTQIAAQQGAIPKTSKPPTELSVFARAKVVKQQEPKDGNKQGETLEDMVKRLQQLPFPSSNSDEQATNDATNSSSKEESQEPESAENTNDSPTPAERD